MSDVFISYSRIDKEFVGQLREALLAKAQDVWIDWESIPPSQAWWNEIQKGIARANNFVVVLSPHSMASPICQMEIEYAHQLRKRIIPILHMEYDREESLVNITKRLALKDQQATREIWGGRQPHDLFDANDAALKPINYFFFKADADFPSQFDELLTIIHTDYAHKEQHTTLELRAQEWNKRARNASFLLIDDEMAQAQAWLAAAPGKAPPPTDLQNAYIQASAKRTRQLRNILRASVIGSIVAALALVFATVASLIGVNATNSASLAGTREASANIRVANANATLTPISVTLTKVANTIAQGEARSESLRLAAEATNALNAPAGNSTIASLLAIRALYTAYTVQADNALQLALAHNQIVFGLSYNYPSTPDAAFSPDDQAVLIHDSSESFSLWSTQTGARRHTWPGVMARFASDGRRVLTISNDGMARWWNANTGAEESSFALRSLPKLLVLSPDNRTILTVKDDGLAQRWDGKTGQVQHSFSVGDSPREARFLPDGRHVLINYFSAQPRLWDFATGTLVRSFELKSYAHADLSPDGKWLVGVDSTGDALIVEVSTGKVRRLPENPDRVWLNVVQFSPDGQTVGIGRSDGFINLWNTETGELNAKLDGKVPLIGRPAHHEGVVSMDFTHDGRRLITGNADGLIRVWDLDLANPFQEARETRRLQGHDESVDIIKTSPNGRFFFSSSTNGRWFLWQTRTVQETQQLRGHNDAVWNAIFSPDGRRIVTAGWDGSLRLWDSHTLQQLKSGSAYAANIGLAISPEGKHILVGNNSFVAANTETAFLLDADTLNLVREFTGGGTVAEQVAFSREGTYALLAAGSAAALWDVKGGILIRKFSSPTIQWVKSIAYSPDDRYVAIGSGYGPYFVRQMGGNSPIVFEGTGDGTARIFEAVSDREIHILRGYEASVLSMAFSPDSSALLTSTGDGLIRLWDVKKGSLIYEFKAHNAVIPDVAYAPDGKHFLTAGADNVAKLWDARTGMLVRELKGHTGPVLSVAFSPDGDRIMTAGVDRVVQGWDTDYKRLIQRACESISRDFTPGERRQFDIKDTKPTCPQLATPENPMRTPFPPSATYTPSPRP